MSGLELSAAIIGIIGATGQIALWLHHIKEGVSDVPQSVDALNATIEETKSVMEGLDRFLKHLDVKSGAQQSPIETPAIRKTMTAIVLILSELEKQVFFSRNSEGNIRAFDRGKWIFREKRIEGLRGRLESHKLSLLLMLNILQNCTGQETFQRILQIEQVNRTVAEDSELQRHLQKYEHEEVVGFTAQNEDIPDIPMPTIISVSETENIGIINTQSTRQEQHYDDILKISRPYRRVKPSYSRVSLLSRIGSERGVAYSIFSNLTANTISGIAVYNLPISPTDLYNSDWYDFRVTSKEKNPFRPTKPGPPNSRRIYCFPDYLDDNAQISQPNPSFVERGDIYNRMCKAVDDQKQGTATMILWGGPGCGKSEIALDFLHRYSKQSQRRPKYLFGMRRPKSTAREDLCQLWITAADEKGVRDGFLYLAKRIGLLPNDSGNEALAIESIVLWLRAKVENWVLVLDGISDLDFLAKLRIWGNPRGTVIITTRSHRLTDFQVAVRAAGFRVPSNTDWGETIAMAKKINSIAYDTFVDGCKDTEELEERLFDTYYFPLSIRACFTASDRLDSQLPIFRTSEQNLTPAVVLKQYRIEDGYRLPTYRVLGLGGGQPLHEIWRNEFWTRHGLDEQDLKFQAKDATIQRLITNVVACLSPCRITDNLLEVARRYFCDMFDLFPDESGLITVADIPFHFPNNEYDHLTSQLLDRTSYLMMIPPKLQIEALRLACSFILTWIDALHPPVPNDEQRAEIFTISSDIEIFGQYAKDLGTTMAILLSIEYSYQEDWILDIEEAQVLQAILKIIQNLLRLMQGKYEPQVENHYQEVFERMYGFIIKHFPEPLLVKQMDILSVDINLSAFAFYLHTGGIQCVNDDNFTLAMENFQAARSRYELIWLDSHVIVGGRQAAQPDAESCTSWDMRLRVSACTLNEARCLVSRNLRPSAPGLKVESKDLKTASKNIRTALEYMEKENFPGCFLGQANFILGDILTLLESRSDAMKAYLEAIQYFSRCDIDDGLWVAAVQARIGGLWIKSNAWLTAKSFLKQALTVFLKFIDSGNSHDWIVSAAVRIHFMLFLASTKSHDDTAAEIYRDLAWEFGKRFDKDVTQPQLYYDSGRWISDNYSFYMDCFEGLDYEYYGCEHLRECII